MRSTTVQYKYIPVVQCPIVSFREVEAKRGQRKQPSVVQCRLPMINDVVKHICHHHGNHGIPSWAIIMLCLLTDAIAAIDLNILPFNETLLMPFPYWGEGIGESVGNR